MAVDSPNYTEVPNQLLGDILKGNVIQIGMLADMGLAELKVFLAVCRLTFGYHQNERRASLTTLQKLTGLSRQGVLDGAADAEKRGIIERIQDGGITLWRVLVKPVDQPKGEVVKAVDQPVKPVDQIGQEARPPSKKETRNKPEKETKERGAAEKTPPAPSLREQAKAGEMTTETELDLLCGFGRQGKAGVADPSQDIAQYMQYTSDFLEMYRKRTGLHADSHVQKPAIQEIAAQPGADLDLWDKVITAWVKVGWNKRNVAGMIECYERGEIPSTNGGKANATPRRSNHSGSGLSGNRKRPAYSVADISQFSKPGETT